MRILKWIALGIIVASLILVALHGFLLNNKVSKQGEVLAKLGGEHRELSNKVGEIGNSLSVIPEQGKILEKLDGEQRELSDKVEEIGNSLSVILDLRQILRDVLGGGTDIKSTNPLIVQDGGGHSYSAFYEHHRAGGYTGTPFDDYWFGAGWGPDGQRNDGISSFWYDDEFHQPEGWGNVVFTTRESFYYPLWTAQIRWNPNAGKTIFWIGLMSGAGVNAGMAAFHMVNTDRPHLSIVVVDDAHEITSLAPPDWTTAFHWYQIRRFPDGAEFYIDRKLVALAVVGPELPSHPKIENGVLFVATRAPNSLSYQPRNWLSPYMRGLLLTEGDKKEASLSIPFEYYGISDMSGDYTRTYQNLSMASLAGGASTSLSDCLTIPVNTGSKLALTVRGTYHAEATQGIKVHIYTSYDGLNYDSEELKDASGNPVFGSMPLAAGTTRQKTMDISTNARFVKVTIENLDKTQAVTDVEVIATLGG